MSGLVRAGNFLSPTCVWGMRISISEKPGEALDPQISTHGLCSSEETMHAFGGITMPGPWQRLLVAKWELYTVPILQLSGLPSNTKKYLPFIGMWPSQWERGWEKTLGPWGRKHFTQCDKGYNIQWNAGLCFWASTKILVPIWMGVISLILNRIRFLVLYIV